MSRIGREPIPVPEEVKVTINKEMIQLKGKLGELEHCLPDGITAALDDGRLQVTRRDDSRGQRALHGLTRALLANKVQGVSTGFSKALEIVGVGYRCDMKGKALQLAVGFSHKVIFIPPDGITIKTVDQTHFVVSGIDKAVVGDVAAKIRKVRPPEPYKGKGIRYKDEYVRRKAGKSAAK